jgi:hypothetical protein
VLHHPDFDEREVDISMHKGLMRCLEAGDIKVRHARQRAAETLKLHRGERVRTMTVLMMERHMLQSMLYKMFCNLIFKDLEMLYNIKGGI